MAFLSREDAVGAAPGTLIGGSRMRAPYLIDAEAGQALRGLERRGEITSLYDGLYAVLAGRLGMPLLTGDLRLSKASGLPCQVEVIR